MKILASLSVMGMLFSAIAVFSISEELMTAGTTLDAWILRATGVALTLSIPIPILLLAALENKK